MPDEPEIDIDKLREQIDQEVEHSGGLLKPIALTTALLAVCAAIASLRAGATATEALMLRTEATRLQAEASDQWAFYQAKGLKAAVLDVSRTVWLAAGKEPPADYAENKARYAAQQQEIEATAREKEKERDRKLEESGPLLHAHGGFANAVAIFQVAIALGAIAALTRSRAVWFGSLILGTAGAILLGASLLL